MNITVLYKSRRGKSGILPDNRPVKMHIRRAQTMQLAIMPWSKKLLNREYDRRTAVPTRCALENRSEDSCEARDGPRISWEEVRVPTGLRKVSTPLVSRFASRLQTS